MSRASSRFTRETNVYCTFRAVIVHNARFDLIFLRQQTRVVSLNSVSA